MSSAGRFACELFMYKSRTTRRNTTKRKKEEEFSCIFLFFFFFFFFEQKINTHYNAISFLYDGRVCQLLGAPLRASTSPDAQTVKGKKILKEPLAAREERAKTVI